MKKPTFWIPAFFISATGTILFAFCWVLNLLIAINVLGGYTYGGEWLCGRPMPRFLPQFFSAIIYDDLSTVTTALICVFFACIFIGLFRLFHKSYADIRKRNPHFPFPEGYRNVFIQLGLLGTLFAFIFAFNTSKSIMDDENIKRMAQNSINSLSKNRSVTAGEKRSTSQRIPVENSDEEDSDLLFDETISAKNDSSEKAISNFSKGDGKVAEVAAYSDEDEYMHIDDNGVDITSKIRNDSMRLIAALGTALWSTFSAVLLAFILCPGVEKIFKLVYSKEGPVPPSDPIDIAVTKLTVAISQLNKYVSKSSTEFETFEGKLSSLGGFMDVQNTLNKMAKQIEALQNWKQQQTIKNSQADSRLDSISVQLTTISESIMKFTRSIETNSKEIAEAHTVINGLHDKILESEKAAKIIRKLQTALGK